PPAVPAGATRGGRALGVEKTGHKHGILQPPEDTKVTGKRPGTDKRRNGDKDWGSEEISSVAGLCSRLT
ncbi:unnamed protein product, partial [Ixodes persulcatus]